MRNCFDLGRSGEWCICECPLALSALLHLNFKDYAHSCVLCDEDCVQA